MFGSTPPRPPAGTDQSSALQLEDLAVDYGDAAVLSGINLSMERGELIALLGPSGAGKSTLVNTIAGLIAPSAGRIMLAGKLVADGAGSLPPDKRAVGLVYQNYALWPHLSAVATVAYPMRRAGMARIASERAALELLDRLGIKQLADRKPAELSGGEQQRVGLARALAREPQLYLLDEPTAHLDTQLRATFQAELRTRQLRSGAAALCATHDPAEALAIADRLALIIGGRLIQQGTPTEVYDRPVSVAAAQLTGTASILSARVSGVRHGLLSIDLGNGAVEVPGDTASGLLQPRGSDALRDVLVRPEWTTDDGPFIATIGAQWFRGPHTDYLVSSAAGELLLRRAGPPRYAVGAQLRWGLSKAWVLGLQSDRSSQNHQHQQAEQPVAARSSQPSAAAMPR